MGNFKSSYGFGNDDISSYFLKIGMPILAPSLCQIFNLSLSKGTFLDSWKIACVKLIFKEGSTDSKRNYRPISVLPIVSRLFKKIIFNQLYSNLGNKLYTGQSGFRALQSVLTCFPKSTHDWCLNKDAGKYTSTIFVGLKKAFDTVD